MSDARKPLTDRARFVHYADELSKDERDALIREYRAQGWTSIAIREIREPAGSAYGRRYEVELGR